jgi:hypothetical protein
VSARDWNDQVWVQAHLFRGLLRVIRRHVGDGEIASMLGLPSPHVIKWILDGAAGPLPEVPIWIDLLRTELKARGLYTFTDISEPP